ncbi:PAS-domain containing protein [Donghicola sp.]|uniref:hybrid sensor histidine kinase/response regulator n=1 Tax=Donghicola sp. TaxID=1929294 RepID=UPI0025F45318|nr:PAS-domain containing protein [Donghicola sp.]MCT4576500.1 PAS-domain containing protein [Donghicola sp.]
MINPSDPPEEQIRKQAKIIDALIRRMNHQHELGNSAYATFQSAVSMQAKMMEQSRDLERTTSELANVRIERERTRKNLTSALAAMEGGFALFNRCRLEVSNELFQMLLPDISARIQPGLEIDEYIEAMLSSEDLVGTDGRLFGALAQVRRSAVGAAVNAVVAELIGDRFFQVNLQRTSEDNIVILLTDISRIVRQNRSEKENLIDRQATYLQAVFQNMTSGVCTFDSDGRVKMYNQRFRQLLGLPYTLLQTGSELELIVRHVRSHAVFEDEDAFDVGFWMERLQKQGRFRSRLRHANGRILDMHSHVLPDGGFVVDLGDVSAEIRTAEMLENRVAERTAELTEANARLREQYEEKARVEEKLRVAKEAAEAAVSSKTRFLAAASHDLLQPINAAKLLISTIKEATQGATVHPMVERLQSSFTSTEQLLHALLDISRLDSADSSALQPANVCLGTLMQGVYEDQLRVAEKRGVRLDVVPAMVFVRSDPVYLLRSIQNLVVNAIQYTPSGGRVLVGCRRKGDEVVLEVWDTGIGITLKDQSKIFEEFTRAGNVPIGSGVGLGLSIVERTCRHMGHTVSVKSKPNVGSVFSIRMQRVAVQPEAIEERVPINTNESSTMDLIVLVVEDDPAVLFAMIKKLEQWGASVLGASSTEEALGHVRDMGIPPDIMLADYQLGKTDTGINAINAVRTLTSMHVPAVMITADRGDHLLKMGAEHRIPVLTKPVRLRKLRPLIEWLTRDPMEPLTRSGTDQSRQ